MLSNQALPLMNHPSVDEEPETSYGTSRQVQKSLIQRLAPLRGSHGIADPRDQDEPA